MEMSVIMLPLFLYAVVKECLKRLILLRGSSRIIFLSSNLSIIITAILLVPIIPIMLLLAIYRSIIKLYLQKIHKTNYRGLMDGLDSICCNQENCVLSSWIFVEFNGGLKELKAAVVKQLERVMTKGPEKVFYSRGECMGYHYYFTENVPAENYITLMETNGGYIDKKILSKMFMSYNRSPMPCNDQKLLNVVICPQPVYLDEYPDANIYCVIYKLHHCIGDAKTGLRLFTEYFGDGKLIDEHQDNENKNELIYTIKKFISNNSIKELPLTVSDKNALRGYTLTENKHIIWFSDTSTAYVDNIRKIKKSINGVSFLGVINTCLASSLCDYYKKRDLPILNTVIAGVTFSVEITNSGFSFSDAECENKFSVVGLRLPVGFDNEDSLMDRLKFLKQEQEMIRKSLDIQFNYFCVQNITKLLPTQIMRWLSKFVQITIGVSSFPGCERFTFFGGNEVKDFLVALPNTPGTALHMNIYTYKGQLRIVFTADKSVMPEYEDAQEIVQGLITYLDKLTDLF